MAATETTCNEEVDKLYKDHHWWLLGWLRRKLNGSEHVADLAQDTFVSIMASNGAATIREPRPFLATVAKRLVANHYRRQTVERSYLDALASLPETMAPPPEIRAIALQALIAIDRALDGLRPKEREAFLLAHLEGWSYADIARHINVSISSIKQYLIKANQQCLFAIPA